MPPTATAYKTAGEHLSGQTLHDTFFGSSPLSKEQLESYLVPKNGVQLHRDQVNITIRYSSDPTDKEVIDSRELYRSWKAVWHAILPRIKTLILEAEKGPDPAKDNKTVVISTSTNEWLIIRNTQGIPAHKHNQGQIVATGDPPVPLPEDISYVARWGSQYIGPRRNSFPLPSDYSLEDSQISLDKLTMKSITNIISYKKRRPPQCSCQMARANQSSRPYK
jgi:hypothetical protein